MAPELLPRILAAARLLACRGLLVLLLCGVAPLALAQGAATEWDAITLEQAISEALSAAPSVVEARGSVLTAEAARKRSLGAYLPSVAASSSAGLSSSERIDPTAGTTLSGSSATLSAGLSASWDVFTGFRRSAERARTGAQLHGAEATLEDRRRALILQVTASFYEALSAEQLLVVSDSRVERARGGLTAAQRRAEVGSATRSDVLRAQVEVNSAKTQALEVANALRDAERALGRLIGRSQPVRAEPRQHELAVRAEVYAPERLEELVAQHPAVVASEALAGAAAAGIRVARAAYWPSARMSAGYDYLSPFSEFPDGRTGWSVRLGLSIPIFDGFQRDENSQRAEVQLANAQAQLADLRRGIRVEIQSAVDRLTLTRERLELADESVIAAREDLRVQQERYRLGASTMLELLTSQQALVEAETNAIDARFDHVLARAQLEALTRSTP